MYIQYVIFIKCMGEWIQPFYLLYHWWFFGKDVQSGKTDLPRKLKWTNTLLLFTSILKACWNNFQSRFSCDWYLSWDTQKEAETCRVILPPRSTLLHLPLLTFSLFAALRWACAAFLKLIWLEAADIQFLASDIKKRSKFSLLTEHFEFGPSTAH